MALSPTFPLDSEPYNSQKTVHCLLKSENIPPKIPYLLYTDNVHIYADTARLRPSAIS